MDIAVSTCPLSLSIQFLLIKLSSTLCYRKVLNQGHCLLSDERKWFSAFILLRLLTSHQHHLLNLFLMETCSTAQTCFLLPWVMSWCILPLYTSFYPSCLLILSFRKLSWSQGLQNPCGLLTLCFKLCTEVMIRTSSVLTRYSHLIAHFYKTELLIPPSPLTSPAIPRPALLG